MPDNRHSDLIRATLLGDVIADVRKRFEWKDLTGQWRRVSLNISHFTAKFMATCEATENGMEILKEYPFFAVQLVIGIKVDGIDLESHRAEFSKKCFSDPIVHEEIVEGTGGSLFSVIEPVVLNGWCKSCDRPYKWSLDFSVIVCPKCGAQPPIL